MRDAWVTKGYLLLELSTNKLFVGAFGSVVFDEASFPLAKPSSNESSIEEKERASELKEALESKESQSDLPAPSSPSSEAVPPSESEAEQLSGVPSVDSLFPNSSYYESDRVIDVEQRYEVKSILDYRIADETNDRGEPIQEEQFKVWWKDFNKSEATWEPRSSLIPHAQEVLAEAESTLAHKIESERRSMNWTDHELKEERPLSRESDWVTLQNLAAKVERVPLRSNPAGQICVGPNGEVAVPQLNPLLPEFLQLTSKCRGPALDKEEATQLREDCELFCMKARVKPAAPKGEEPANYWEAIKSVNSDSWQDAMRDELQNMRDFHVWDIVPRPKDRNVMSCKWVYKIKGSKMGQSRR